MVETQEHYYQEIGKWLARKAPEAWTKIQVDFRIIEMDSVSERSIYYVPEGKPKALRQFNISDTNFTSLFYGLARATSTADKGLFKKCKFVVNKDGRYSCDFEYD